MTVMPIIGDVKAGPKLAIAKLATFLKQHSLPLWASAGFDATARCFEERLDFRGQPVKTVPRRLLVQARQIVVYARSSLSGWHPAKQLALDAFENACKRYYSSDMDRGWVFSLHPDGSVADATRDLYSHAFALYMLAWVYRLTGDPAVLARADATLLDIDRVFGNDSELGFLSKVPGRADMREQNPHMHLFESLIALAEFSGAERYIDRAGTMVALFDKALSDTETGTVRELFDANWRPVKSKGENAVEPGHQMEWSWLLREWQRLTGNSVEDRIHKMFAHTMAFGIDTSRGLVRGIVREDGEIVSNAARVWPQTESIRALCREDADGTKWPRLVSTITDNLFATHLQTDIAGGWIDQTDAGGKAMVDYMPASTLYHLFGAAIDSEAVVGT